MKNNKILIILIGIIIICILILLYKSSNNKYTNIYNKNNINNTNTIQQIAEKNEVYIKEHKGYSYQIKGIVKNGTKQKVNNLTISADIYDSNNNKIRSTKTYLESLEPNETWSFSLWSGEKNYKYKNLKVTYIN